MTQRKQGRNLLLMSLVALILCGCSASRTTVTRPTGPPAVLQTATKDDLIAQYNHQADSVRSLNATVTMALTAGSAYTGVIRQYHQVNGFIIAQRPTNIRVIGQAPLVGTNIFDMESDGKTFHIFIPSQNKFLTGPANLERPSAKPIENLRPQHLTGAIFWDAITNKDLVLFEEASEGNSQYYVLTVAQRSEGEASREQARSATTGWEISRKIWFDRADLNVARLQIYEPGGRLGSDIQYGGWDVFGAEKYPRQIAISRPHDDYKLQIGISNAAFDEPIPADRFVLTQPKGAELVDLGEESPGANPGGKAP